MKVSRIIHMRAPLHVRNLIGKRDIGYTIDPSKAAFNGGCTILLEGDTDSATCTIQIAWCRYSDNYNRKLGVVIAKKKPADVVYLRDLPRELGDIEDQMLAQTSVFLRHHEEARRSCIRNWNSVVRHFLPMVPKEVV